MIKLDINKISIAPLFLAVFLIKLISVFFINSDPKLFEDHDMAVNLLNTGELFYSNDGQINHSFQFPVYPFCLYLLYSVFENQYLVAILFNVLLISLSSWTLVGFLKRFTERKKIIVHHNWIWFVGIILLIYPTTNVYAYGNIHPFSLNLFLLSLMLFVSEKFIQKEVKWYVLGLLFSLVLLQRSSLFVVLFYPLFELRKTFVSEIGMWFKIGLISLLLPVLWMSRNYYHDQVFAMTSTSGKILWKGSLLEGDGSNYIDGDKNYYSFLPDSIKNQLGSKSVQEQNELFKTIYHQNWEENPSGLIKHYFKKLKSFFGFRSEIGTEYKGKESYLMIYKGFYIVLLILVLTILIKYKWEYIGLLLPFLFLGLFQAWFYVETRHRIIFEPVLILICFSGVFEWIQIRFRVVKEQ